MSHPYAAHKQNKVERSRVAHIARGYASGGAVKRRADGGQAKRETLAGETPMDGEKSMRRADRPNRASGGRVKKGHGNSKTIVNVITGGDKAAPPPMVPPMGAGVAPPMAPPPMAMKPPMPPMAGPGGPPPMPMRAKGGRVNDGTKVFEASERAGTKVTHDPGKNDLADGNLNRPRVVTFKTGGGVKTFMAGGRVESPDGVAKATKLPGGAGGGKGRLAKAREY